MMNNKVFDNKDAVVDYINNNFEGYAGYVQFSNGIIKDIFEAGEKINVSSEFGFVFEAHFSNGTESVSIRQINNEWYVSKTDISKIENKKTDIQKYVSIGKIVEMAQIWETVPDERCAQFNVKKLKKVVFAGFEGEKND